VSRYATQEARRAAFEAEALPHLDRVFATARRLLRSGSPEAEDLVQETFLRAYRTFDGFEPGTNARAWLFTIMYSVLSNRLRRRRLEPEAEPDETLELRAAQRSLRGEDGASQLDASRAWGAGVDLEAALGRLPETARAVVLLVDVEGLSYEEASKALDWPVGTVRSRLSRARNRLASELEAYAPQAGESKRGEA